jgi:hypothetical protein
LYSVDKSFPGENGDNMVFPDSEVVGSWLAGLRMEAGLQGTAHWGLSYVVKVIGIPARAFQVGKALLLFPPPDSSPCPLR